MSEKKDKFSKQLDKLIATGDELLNAIQNDCYPEQFRKTVKESVSEEESKIICDNLPSFRDKYQVWYSEAKALIKQILPDRLDDFVSYYEFPKVRKDITYQNYMIKDYLQGLRITRGYQKDIVVDESAAIPEFVQQLNIVRAARKILDSALMDIRSVLQADLFDTEIESAAALAKAGYLRASGAVCGVVIEKHLTQICLNHGIKIKKKNPTINDLNQLLKDQDIITVAQWRFVQHLADIRNTCDHAKSKEPTKDEINGLVDGTNKILKTIF